MITKIKYRQVKLVLEQAPEWEIPIRRKAVAIAQDDPGTIGVAMHTYADGRTIAHRQFQGFERLRYLKCHCNINSTFRDKFMLVV